MGKILQFIPYFMKNPNRYVKAEPWDPIATPLLINDPEGKKLRNDVPDMIADMSIALSVAADNPSSFQHWDDVYHYIDQSDRLLQTPKAYPHKLGLYDVLAKPTTLIFEEVGRVCACHLLLGDTKAPHKKIIGEFTQAWHNTMKEKPVFKDWYESLNPDINGEEALLDRSAQMGLLLFFHSEKARYPTPTTPRGRAVYEALANIPAHLMRKAAP